MITRVSDIMIRKNASLNAADSLYMAQRVMLKEDVDCLPVFEDGRLIGLLTLHDIINSNPNRIVIDAMKSNFALITPDATIIEAVEILKGSNTKALLVADDNGFLGVVTKNRLHEEYSKLFDTLTGLFRSQYVYQKCEEFLKDNKTLSIIFIDVDKFGEIDKEYGHVFGDMVIKELGVLLEENTPDGVYLARYGGDEFVLLSDFPIERCKSIAVQILTAISMHDFSNGIRITASAGIVSRKNINRMTANTESIIANLINLASLASTKAKSEKKQIIAVGEEIANEGSKIRLVNKIRVASP